ncbi:MAG TPA: hypothetical protein DCM45_04265, partial [Clostridiales bacterium]|nr:hypothetical protein [Clostridiales bacterium]
DDDHYYILDKQTGALTVFVITDYGRSVLSAITAYESGRYDESAAAWASVLDRNANMELAYNGIGKALYSQGRYQEAMQYFRNGNNKTWYSKAYKEHRKTLLAFWFPALIIAVLVLYIAAKAIKIIRKTRWVVKGGAAQ